MLVEAVEIIAALFEGGHVDIAGDHFRVDSATLWDLPDARVPIAVAVSGDQSVHRFAPLADAMIAVEPVAELCDEWDRVGRFAAATQFVTKDDVAANIRAAPTRTPSRRP